MTLFTNYTESITVAVISMNEGHELRDCLESCRGADKYIVLDMESRDDTIAVAESFGAHVIQVPRVPIAEQIRQVAVEATTTDWLLWIDADERGPGDIRTALLPHLSSEVDAYWIPTENVAFGSHLPNLSARTGKIILMRPKAAHYWPDSPAHAGPYINGSIGSLVGVVQPFRHFGLRTLDEGIEKVVRYARTGGSTFRTDNNGDPLLLPRLVWYSVVRRKAWKDGTAGMVAASLEIIGNYLSAVSTWERSGAEQQYVGRRARAALEALAAMDDGARRLLVSTKRLIKRTQPDG